MRNVRDFVMSECTRCAEERNYNGRLHGGEGNLYTVFVKKDLETREKERPLQVLYFDGCSAGQLHETRHRDEAEPETVLRNEPCLRRMRAMLSGLKRMHRDTPGKKMNTTATTCRSWFRDGVARIPGVQCSHVSCFQLSG
jgi:hypothetical protein